MPDYAASAAVPVIEAVPEPTGELRALIAELETVLSAEYPPEQRHGLPLEAIFRPEIRFFLARLDGAAVGCGGVALFADFAEVKRMYVREAARSRGVARALLARIEAEASALVSCPFHSLPSSANERDKQATENKELVCRPSRSTHGQQVFESAR